MSGCAQVLEHAGGMPLGFEPEPGMLVDTIAGWRRLRKALGEPEGFGLTLDIGHCRCNEPDPVPGCVTAVAEHLVGHGREVVVKVQRPDVREVARADMEVLERLASVADHRTDAGRTFGFGRLLEQFRRSLAGELDYRRERATHSVKRRKRGGSRTPWLRRTNLDTGWR